MRGEWTQCKIGDVFTLIPGFAFKSSDFVESGTPVLKIKNVKAGEVVFDDLSFVDDNQGFIAMKPRKGVSSQFLLRWAQVSHDAIVSRANGSTFLEISKANFRPIQLVVPPTNVLEAYDKTCGAIFLQTINAERESRTVAALRDALLPKLISGEMRLPEAERIVRRAT